MHTRRESGQERSHTMALERRRIGWIAGAVAAAVLAYAWIDGGEEPVRTIVEPIAVPGAGG